jgi:hypothetical protein
MLRNHALAINFRVTKEMSLKELINNYISASLMYWPVSYLVRHILETNMSYEKCCELLENAKLISPSYITITNFRDNPRVYVRDQLSYKIYTDETTIQTNCDNDCNNNKKEFDILYSFKRRELFEKVLQEKHNTLNDLIKNLCVFPIINEETIYLTVMSDNYVTKIF